MRSRMSCYDATMRNIFRSTTRQRPAVREDRYHVDPRDDRGELRGLFVEVVERNLDNMTRALTGHKLS